jgi:hypothetical protein
MHPHASHPPDRLRFGHPDWVRKLSRAAGIACWSLALGSAAWVAGEAVRTPLVNLLCRLAVAACGAGLVYAAWRLSSPDPNGSTPDSDTAPRWKLRFALVAAAAGAFLQCVADPRWVGHDWLTAVFVTTLFTTAIDVAGRLVLLTFAWRLALRVPDPRLAARLVSLIPAYAFALSAYFAFDALRSVPMLDRLAPAAAGALAVVTLVVLRHLRQLRRGLDIQADYARGIWSRSPAARPSDAGLAA